MARILVAEDDLGLRRFLVRALRKAGHYVLDFGNGLEALDAIYRDSFDLLLADIVMPEMDGIELANRAARFSPSLKIMFITGFAAVAMNKTGLEVQNTAVVSKPFHLNDLVAQVESMLNNLIAPETREENSH
ncbi:MAG: response regulator [Alphaproteobacteria bacterium]